MLASLSCFARLLLSKQSGITARTNFSFHVLVLPAKARIGYLKRSSLLQYVFNEECLYPYQEQTK